MEGRQGRRETKEKGRKENGRREDRGMEDGGMERETKEKGGEGGSKQNLRNKSTVPIFWKLEMWYAGWLFILIY
ncbi:MAG: hypothetical protein KAF40_07595 [Flavihumibacter sp.]|nr:hypothetical protein [Flavihumibacter sp.]